MPSLAWDSMNIETLSKSHAIVKESVDYLSLYIPL